MKTLAIALSALVAPRPGVAGTPAKAPSRLAVATFAGPIAEVSLRGAECAG